VPGRKGFQQGSATLDSIAESDLARVSGPLRVAAPIEGDRLGRRPDLFMTGGRVVGVRVRQNRAARRRRRIEIRIEGRSVEPFGPDFEKRTEPISHTGLVEEPRAAGARAPRRSRRVIEAASGRVARRWRSQDIVLCSGRSARSLREVTERRSLALREPAPVERGSASREGDVQKKAAPVALQHRGREGRYRVLIHETGVSAIPFQHPKHLIVKGLCLENFEGGRGQGGV